MRIIARLVTPGNELKPGEIFSTKGQEFWDKAILEPISLVESVYIRTNTPCLGFKSGAFNNLYRITIIGGNMEKIDGLNLTTSDIAINRIICMIEDVRKKRGSVSKYLYLCIVCENGFGWEVPILLTVPGSGMGDNLAESISLALVNKSFIVSAGFPSSSLPNDRTPMWSAIIRIIEVEDSIFEIAVQLGEKISSEYEEEDKTRETLYSAIIIMCEISNNRLKKSREG